MLKKKKKKKKDMPNIPDHVGLGNLYPKTHEDYKPGYKEALLDADMSQFDQDLDDIIREQKQALKK